MPNLWKLLPLHCCKLGNHRRIYYILLFLKNPFFTLTINGSKAKKGLAGAAAAAAVLCWQGNGEGGTMEKR